MENIIDKATIGYEELRKLCIDNNWFTCGSIRQYEKLFDRDREGASLDELTTIIWICSDETHTKQSIYMALLVYVNEKRAMEKIIGFDMFGYETELDPHKLVCDKCADEMGLTDLMWYEIPEGGTCSNCGRKHNGMLYEKVD